MFTPHQVVIQDLKDSQHIVAIGSVDDIISLYKFDNFGSPSFPSMFIAHSDDVSRLWHEWFGHLNYRSLQNLCKENMVIGLLMVSCKDGVCSVVYLKNIIGTVWKTCLLACLSSLIACAQWLMWSPSSNFLFWFQVFLNFYWWLLQMHLGILLKTQEWSIWHVLGL